MGCDIHLFVEVNHGGVWSEQKPAEDWSASKLEHSVEPIDSYELGKWFSDRNYALFAWLAGVRNYHNQEPLAQPRGMPPLCSVGIRKQKRYWGSDGHAHTWFTVAELMAGLEGLVTKHGGAVNVIDYAQWKASGSAFPASWCQSSSAPNISESDFAAGQRPEVKGPLAWALFTIECEWTVPGEVAFSRFKKLLDELLKLGDPRNTRLVFWFDN